jgi:hypothetical protein
MVFGRRQNPRRNIKQFPEKKVKAMRDELLSLGVEYI